MELKSRSEVSIPTIWETQKTNARIEASKMPTAIGPWSKANALPKELKGSAKHDTTIKSSLKIRESEKVRMEPPVTVTFKCPAGMDKKEFVRQVNGQQRGLNSMNVDRWIKNRDNYKMNGRSLEGAEAQRLQRQKAYHSRIESNQNKGMSFSSAKHEADNWIKGQAALHNPDQIAGGDPRKVSRMGDAHVNSSIGSQWKNNIDQLESAIKTYAKGRSSDELARTKLNVKLITEG